MMTKMTCSSTLVKVSMEIEGRQEVVCLALLVMWRENDLFICGDLLVLRLEILIWPDGRLAAKMNYSGFQLASL